MKTLLRSCITLPVSALTTALLLAAAGPALAWPFVEKPTGNTANGRHETQNIAFFQMDGDRDLEFCYGDNRVSHRSPGTQPTSTFLPQFNSSPYIATDSNVNFSGNDVVTGDIDGDGDTDLVRAGSVGYASGASSEVYVRIMCLHNNSAGSFTAGWEFVRTAPPANRPDGAGASSLLLGDFDGDGDLDLVNDWDAIRINWNPGNGDFGAASQALSMGYDRIDGMAQGDFDGNGALDFLVTLDGDGTYQQEPSQTQSRVLVFYNQGAGTFTPSSLYPATSENYGSPVMVDMDGDGRKDLVAEACQPGTGMGSRLVWYRNNGASFDSPQALLPYGIYFAAGLCVGDLDEDGRDDILMRGSPVNSPTHRLVWMRNQGNGTVAAPALLQEGILNTAFGLADQDQDGDLDVFYNAGTNILENTAIHRMPSASASVFAGTNPTGTVDLAAGDMNDDGRPDLIVADGGGRRLLWYAGGSGLAAPWPVSTGNEAPTSVASADLDSDGADDLVWTHTNTIERSMNSNGLGTAWVHAAVHAMNGVNRICLADMDGDADQDILALSPSATLLRWYAGSNSANTWTWENIATAGSGMQAMAAGQVSPGGRMEVALTRTGSAGGCELRRHTSGAWSPAFSQPAAGSGITAVCYAEILPQRQGQEIIFAGADGSLNLKSSDGTNTVIATGGTTRQVLAVDWDHDGYLDVVRAGSMGVELFASVGPAWFTRPVVTLLSGVNVQDIVTLPLDSDDLPDIVAVSTTGQLHLLTNTSHQIKETAASLGPVRAAPGTPAPVISLTHSYDAARANPPAGVSSDAVAFPGTHYVRFLRAIPQGTGYTPGSSMTQAEVDAVVEGMLVNGNHAGRPVEILSGLFSFFSTTANGTGVRTLALGLKSTASSAPVQNFYVVTGGAEWRPYNGSVSGPSLLSVDRPGGPATALVQIGTLTALQQWRYTHFGTYYATGSAANEADPDGDGVPNLLEYAAGRSPVAGQGPLALTLTPPSQNSPALASVTLLSSADPSLKLILEQSTSLTSWTPLATRTGTAAWTLAPATTSVPGSSLTTLTFTTGTTLATPRYFLRLKAEELP